MQFWSANVTKRVELESKTTTEILEKNKKLTLRPMAAKTVWMALLPTCAHDAARYGGPPISRSICKLSGEIAKELTGVQATRAARARLLNKIFSNGVASGLLDQAMLPLLAYLTSRRIGLLTHLCGDDLRKKDGVWIAQTSGIKKEGDVWVRVPIKTEEPMTSFVLHNFLDEIGFAEWARAREG